MKNWTFVKLILCVLLLFSGCVASKGRVDSRVKILQQQMPSELTITEVASRVNPSGFMEVRVTGRNKGSEYARLQYRVDWLDQDGFPIKSLLSRWTSVPAYADSEFQFGAVAPNSDAADFRIKIRKGD